MCVLMCGWVLHKVALKKFQILSSAFWLAGKLRKVSFSTKTCGTKKSHGASSVTLDRNWFESVPKLQALILLRSNILI